MSHRTRFFRSVFACASQCTFDRLRRITIDHSPLCVVTLLSFLWSTRPLPTPRMLWTSAMKGNQEVARRQCISLTSLGAAQLLRWAEKAGPRRLSFSYWLSLFAQSTGKRVYKKKSGEGDMLVTIHGPSNFRYKHLITVCSIK